MKQLPEACTVATFDRYRSMQGKSAVAHIAPPLH
jgi:hypothetical protein